VFDVHPPNASIHGWRDFLVHLATITMQGPLYLVVSLMRSMDETYKKFLEAHPQAY
jgi:hypothetical protein